MARERVFDAARVLIVGAKPDRCRRLDSRTQDWALDFLCKRRQYHVTFQFFESKRLLKVDFITDWGEYHRQYIRNLIRGPWN